VFGQPDRSATTDRRKGGFRFHVELHARFVVVATLPVANELVYKQALGADRGGTMISGKTKPTLMDTAFSVVFDLTGRWRAMSFTAP
jgi:hypothetical protein